MRHLALVAAALLLSLPTRASAQGEVPSLGWKTITTENFRIHFEPGLEAWSEQLASQIEGVRIAVAARVGYTPPRVIDVLVEDPLNQPNGSAWPSMTYPAMRFWATPPAPTSLIGNSRGWGDILAVHEYAHLAHLLRPSRTPLAFPLAVLSVVPVGPLVTSPAWVTEGYATLIEGELTGSGRPNGAMRPAIIRTLALEGYLPSYDGLNSTGRFNGGAMRYLIGSAYLEWLQSVRGDSALPQLWRRASARTDRNFAQAFTATFGDAPDLLYGRFSAEVTQQAFAVRTELEAEGLAQGDLVQKWAWGVGAPDVSPNGERIAVRRSSPNDAGGVMIFSLEPDPQPHGGTRLRRPSDCRRIHWIFRRTARTPAGSSAWRCSIPWRAPRMTRRATWPMANACWSHALCHSRTDGRVQISFSGIPARARSAASRAALASCSRTRRPTVSRRRR